MNIHRFDERTAQFEQQKKHTGRILLYGNSYLDYWNPLSLDSLFAHIEGPAPVYLNHSIGGITSAELWHYYPRLVRPYTPCALIWCEGANDFEQGYTASEAFNYAQSVFDTVRLDFPGVPLILMTAIRPPKVYRQHREWLEGIKAYDRMLKEYTENHDRCLCLDIEPFFLEMGNRPVYLEDNVHLNELGYTLFTQYVIKEMIEFLKEVL